MQKILVTGVNGFVGQHVARAIQDGGHIVIGASNQPTLNDTLTGVVEQYYGLDLTNASEVSKIDLSEIDAIINLAGFAAISGSEGQGDLYNKVNVGVHTVLYEECIQQKVSPRIIAVSTGTVYDSNQTMPISEEGKLVDESQTNEYVVSKLLMERALPAFRDQGLRCIIARPFNHTGPGQLPGFLLPDLADQFLTAQANNQPMRIGNLKTKRDFTDVRDVAKAYTLLATVGDGQLQHDLYNICSGRSVAGETILNTLAKSLGGEQVETEVDPARLRKNDVMDIYGTHQRLSEDTGWQPIIPVEKMVADFVSWKRLQA
jgi:GDP-4-dehydro-6-deoxy-D-mannose reductase